MAYFPTQEELYLLIQQELPEGVYPHSGRPAEYLSTADSASQAQMMRKLYEHMQTAYDNQWPQTANVEGVELHEVARFGQFSNGLTLSARQDRLLARMRALPSMSRPDLRSSFASYLPSVVTSKPQDAAISTAITANSITPSSTTLRVEFKSWNQEGAKWRLGVSLLGVDTILGGGMRAPHDVDVCKLTPAELGLTSDELLDMRRNAYTFEVNVYDGDIVESVTEQMIADATADLTEGEPARSDHIVTSGLRTQLPILEELATTSLHLVADDWDGGATWYDRSASHNNAVRVGTPVCALSKQFYQRYSISAPAGAGFHAPGDDFNASTKRTYEVVVDDNGSDPNPNSMAIIARVDGGATQYGNWLYQATFNVESAVYNSAAAAPWAGSDSYTMAGQTRWGLPVMFHVVIDATARTIHVYRNGVQLTQANNPLATPLATPTGLSLGILGRWNGSALGDNFTGKILEVLRHEEAFDVATIAARVAEFNRLRGY